MVACCHHVVTMMSELVPARERTNRADKTLPSRHIAKCSVKDDLRVNSCGCSRVDPFPGRICGVNRDTYVVLDTVGGNLLS